METEQPPHSGRVGSLGAHEIWRHGGSLSPLGTARPRDLMRKGRMVVRTPLRCPRGGESRGRVHGSHAGLVSEPLIDSVRTRVNVYLQVAVDVEVDDDGKFSFETESTRVFVDVEAHPNGEATIVSVMVPVLIGVPITPSLYEFVARRTDSWRFGHLAMFDQESGEECMLFLCHNLLGDYLDREELLYAAVGLGEAADRAAGEWVDVIGGRKLIER